jgi:hypothetical protein
MLSLLQVAPWYVWESNAAPFIFFHIISRGVVQVHHSLCGANCRVCCACWVAAGMHHASRAVKQQALSKRAMLHMPGAAAAAGQPGAAAAAVAAAAGMADGNLLDSATGAFVHGVEDDVVQVRCHVAGS